ncbi:MAG: hypothetical protein WC783_00400 [Candidatus Paceibacterota bacterium]|jgi:hypothetical protein
MNEFIKRIEELSDKYPIVYDKLLHYTYKYHNKKDGDIALIISYIKWLQNNPSDECIDNDSWELGCRDSTCPLCSFHYSGSNNSHKCHECVLNNCNNGSAWHTAYEYHNKKPLLKDLKKAIIKIKGDHDSILYKLELNLKQISKKS